MIDINGPHAIVLFPQTYQIKRAINYTRYDVKVLLKRFGLNN